jgi:hypothetical protein
LSSSRLALAAKDKHCAAHSRYFSALFSDTLTRSRNGFGGRLIRTAAQGQQCSAGVNKLANFDGGWRRSGRLAPGTAAHCRAVERPCRRSRRPFRSDLHLPASAFRANETAHARAVIVNTAAARRRTRIRRVGEHGRPRWTAVPEQ